MKISALHIANIFTYGLYQGCNESYLRTFLNDKTLDVCDPKEFVRSEEFITVLKELISKSNNPYFGLNYGAFLNIKALGFISEISLNALNIKQAVLILQEYLNNSFPLISLSVREDKSYYSMQLDCTIKDEALRNHLLDSTYCFMLRELRLMLPDQFVPILQLPYTDISAYALQFDMEVDSGEKHVISLDCEVLKTELNKKKINEIECLLPKFMMMLEASNTEYKNFAKQVRRMTLNMCTPEIPSFEQVSKQFPFSNRTIQRKLSTEGFSFRRISDDIKRELSVYLSTGRQMKTQDIARVLGYSESSAYLHAAKRWKANTANTIA